jgi:alanine dehydrogenase
VLLGGVTGVPKAKVVIIGGGTVGTNAAKVSVGMGARTVVLDAWAPRLTYLDDVFGGRIETVLSNEAVIEEEIADADIVVGAVLLPHGAQAPHRQAGQPQEGALSRRRAIDQVAASRPEADVALSPPRSTASSTVPTCRAWPALAWRSPAPLPYSVKIAEGLRER